MTSRRKFVIAAVAAGALGAASVLGVAGAVAASGILAPSEERQAFLDDAAARLGVEPSELRKALAAALESRVDAAVEAGRLTDAQGAELKEGIDSGVPPFLGGLGGPGVAHFGPFGHFGHLDAAATHLGIDASELRERLHDGETLAEIARAEGRSVDGLVQALVQEAEADLDAAVAAGRLTQEQADVLAESLEERMTDLVHGERPGPGFGPRFGDDDRPFGFGPHRFGRHGPHA